MERFAVSRNLTKAVIGKYIEDDKLIAASSDIRNLLNEDNDIIFKFPYGGEYLNHYVKHVISRIITNGDLNVLYLHNLINIDRFISNPNNSQYLDVTGIKTYDVLKVKGFIKKAYCNKRWRNAIIDELHYYDKGNLKVIIDSCKFIKLDINKDIIRIIESLYDVKWRYFYFLILATDSKEIQHVLEVFKSKLDIVNIKYPIKEDASSYYDEYNIMKFLFKNRKTYSKAYHDIVNLALITTEPGLFMDALLVLKGWNISIRSQEIKERIYDFISRRDIKDEHRMMFKDMLEEIHHKEGIYVEF